MLVIEAQVMPQEEGEEEEEEEEPVTLQEEETQELSLEAQELVQKHQERRTQDCCRRGQEAEQSSFRSPQWAEQRKKPHRKQTMQGP